MHRLPWPGDPIPRTIIPLSVLGSSKVPSKRKRNDLGAAAAVTGKPLNQPDGVAVAGRSDVQDNGVRTATNDETFKSTLKDGVTESLRVRDGEQDNEGGLENEEEDQDSMEPRMDKVLLECSCTCSCGASSGGGKSSENGNARVGNASADLSRVEQLVGGAAQARGCALGVEWVARATERSPGLSVGHALDALDATLLEGEGGGLRPLIELVEERTMNNASFDFVAKPRRFEVAAALHRLPGARFSPVALGQLPVDEGRDLTQRSRCPKA